MDVSSVTQMTGREMRYWDSFIKKKGKIFNDTEGYADTLANDENENDEFLSNLGELLSQ